MYPYTKHTDSPFSRASSPLWLMSDAQSRNKSKCKRDWEEKWQNFTSSGAGNSERGAEGKEREEGTGVQVKGL